MKRVQKELTVDNVEKMLVENETVFIVSNPKMKNTESQALRKNLKEVGSEVKVVKNTLLRIIANKNPAFKALEDFFKEQVSLIFAKNNTIKVASIIKSSGYDKKLIAVNAGMINGKIFGKEKFEFIAKIPGEKVLYAQLCGVLISPIAQLAFVLKEVSQKESINV